MKRLYELRKESNMTQEQVAEYLGVTKSFYSRCENGKSQLRISHVLRLVQLYGVSSDYLLGLSDERRQ